MTPAARVAAAIDVLDIWRSGLPAEQALTRWARQSRFAGSKDRAAVRDHVYDVLRCKDTAVAFGGGDSGRALMLGMLRSRGQDVGQFFTGEGYAPDPLTGEEAGFSPPEPDTWFWNMPAWVVDALEISLGDKAVDAAQILQDRAPVTLRVNKQKGNALDACALLAQSDITAIRNPIEENALTVTDGARRLRNSTAYLDGFVELQDAASQAVVALLPTARKCLDYCAGGGGKALAIAAQDNREVFAHDKAPERMKDIALRARRAGVTVIELNDDALAQHALFDLVLCDVPCSGSGAWRRSPEGKWTLTPERLGELKEIQHAVLSEAADLVSVNGWLIYATCSLLKAENEDAVARFLSDHRDWHCAFEKRFDVCTDADGFYTAHLTRVSI
ncbi:MAG: RsmB/NOP family class I SAM-dependent RNA methyltransferase [Roseobacter sp.]